MYFKWCLLFFMLTEAKDIPVKVKNLIFFRCLLEDTFEPCTVFPETSSYNINSISPKLVNEYGNLNPVFHEAVKQRKFTLISEEILNEIPDALLLLLPVNHLTQINSRSLIKVILQRADTKVVKHLLKAYLLGHKTENLLEQTLELTPRFLGWIADALSSKDYGAPCVINSSPLLFYSSPFSVLFNNTSQKLFYLSPWEKSNSISKGINKSYLRIWAYAMKQNNFPGPFSSWNDLYLERWGILLTASTADELSLLNQSNINDFQLLFSLGFSSIQIRTLFDGLMEHIMTYRLDYSTLSDNLVELLPAQLLKFSEKVLYLEQLKVLPSLKSLATSKQIFELMVFQKSRSEENTYSYTNNFSYVLSVKNLSLYVKNTFPSSTLLKIQSSHFSKTQLYILSNGGALFDFNSESIFECNEIVNVLPSRDIIFNQTTPQVLLHLLANIAAENIPQAFSVLNKLWPVLGSSTTLKKILANRGSDILLQYLPSRYITQFVEEILTTVGEDFSSHAKLPDSFVSILLKSLKKAEKNFSLLNIKEPLTFLFNGISCDEISSLDPYDFVIFMLRYNEQRKASGKDFPKKLQHCCVDKFLSYIQLKSTLFQRILGDSKLSLLNEAEIDAIGGYIFSALPTESIASSKHPKNIIKCIGQLSLSELMMAAPISKLQQLGSVFIDENFEVGRKFDHTLFDLGNLTLFLDARHIPQINETFFKLVLESKFIDHRLCAVKSHREAWFNLLKRSFGETRYWTDQTLVTLGDLLIVVPFEELHKIPSKSWIYAADILTYNYDGIIQFSSSLKFYQICMMQLPNSDEAQLYLLELRNLLKTLVDAAQLQLNTVTPVKLLQNKNYSPDEIFTFFDSGKSNIKISIPIIKNLVTTESPINSETSFTITRNENKFESHQFSSVSDLNFSVSEGLPSFTRSTISFSDNGYSEVIIDENSNDKDQYLFNTAEENITETTFASSTNDIIRETTERYIDENKFESQTSSVSDLNFSVSEEFQSITRSTISFSDNGYSEVIIDENSNDKDQYLFNTAEENITGVSLASSTNDIIRETTEGYIDFDQVTPFFNNSYYTSDENGTFEKSSTLIQGISSPTWQPIILKNDMLYTTTNIGEIYHVSSVTVAPSFLNRISEKYLYSTTPKDGTLYSKLFEDRDEYKSSSYSPNLNTEDNKSKNLKYDNVYNSETVHTTRDGVPTEVFTLQASSYSTITGSSSELKNDKISTKMSLQDSYNNYSFNLSSSISGYSGSSTTKTYTEPVSTEKVFQEKQEFDITSTMKSDTYETNSVVYHPIPFSMHSRPPNITEIIHSKNSMNGEAEIELLLKNNSAKTEFLGLNFTSMNTKLKKINPVVIEYENKERRRVKRSFRKWTCDALKMVGKSVEIIITENLIQSMSEEDVSECVDLFSEMDLRMEVRNLIWRKAKLEHIFLSGKLISAINISEVESKNLSVSNPWALETIHLLGKYSDDSKVKQHVIEEILKTTNQKFYVEILVTLASLICQLPQTSLELIVPSEFLKASVILGRSLPCNHSCLLQLSNIAVKEDAFGDPLKWSAEEVSDLGIIIAGLDFFNWKKLIFSKNNSLSGLSERAFKCLPEHYKELKEHRNVDLLRMHLKDQDFYNTPINFDFFEPTFDIDSDLIEHVSYSIKLFDFYSCFHLQMFFIFFIVRLDLY